MRRAVVLASAVALLALLSVVAVSGACTDTRPPGNSYTCAQQKEWGKCGESWMQGYCKATCGTCSTGGGGGGGCNNSPPDSSYTCQQQKDWGKCGESWMKGHCETVCGTCGGGGGGGGGGCTDVAPDAYYSCAQQKEWGKCGESWMSGFCQCTCGASAGGGGGGGGGNAAETASMKALNIKTTSNSISAPLKSYGAQYQTNKRRVVAELKKNFNDAQLKLMLAIAMLETNTMDPDQRDTGKSGMSENFSLWNMNRDYLSRLPGGVDYEMNKWSGLDIAVNRLKAGLNKWGVNDFLNFHRGGATGLADGVSYGCQDYRNAMASMVRILDNNPDLMDDARRIDMVVGHV